MAAKTAQKDIEPDVTEKEAMEKVEKTAEQIIKDAEKKSEEILRNTEDKIREMFEQAGKSTEPAINNITIEQPKEEKAKLPDYIKSMQEDMKKDSNMQLFEDGDKYTGDVFISVNGTHRYQVQRGVSVTVPQYIKNIQEQSQVQDTQTAKLMKMKEQEMLEADKKFGYTG